MTFETTGPILAATDFSDEASGVLGRAVRLADRQECAVHAMHVASSGSPYTAQLRGQIESDLAEAAFGHDVRTAASVLTGGPEVLAGEAKRIAARLVIVAFHRERANDPDRLGSMMEAVLKAVPNDVLLVRPSSAIKDYRRATVAWDGEKPLLPALAAARRVAPEADIVILSAVATSSAEAERRHALRAALREVGTSDTGTAVAAGTLTEVVREQTGRDDLLVLSTRGSVLGALSYKTATLLATRLRDTLCLHPG